MRSAKGMVPESWACIDCGINTAPGMMNRAQIDQGMDALVLTGEDGLTQTFNERSEVYTVKPAVWEAANVGPMGGCPCIGCLEKRLGRLLVPRDFMRGHPFNTMPGTDRLRERRGDFTLASSAMT
jgi:hypothetical protein